MAATAAAVCAPVPSHNERTLTVRAQRRGFKRELIEGAALVLTKLKPKLLLENNRGLSEETEKSPLCRAEQPDEETEKTYKSE